MIIVMEEPKRFSLLDVIQKSLNRANKRTFIHRVIYLIRVGELLETWLLAIEHSIKRANEEMGGGIGKLDQLGALALSSPGYLLVVIEGDDDTFYKHNLALLQECEQRLPINKWKVLSFVPHINKRLLIGWVYATFRPPILLEPFSEPNDPYRHGVRLQRLITNLYKVMQYVSELPSSDFRQGINSLSRACRKHLPETPLLDFLFTSPLLMAGGELFDDKIPPYVPEEDKVWPIPT